MKFSLPSRIFTQLLSEEVVIGIIQVGLIPVLNDTRSLPTGVAQYLDHHLPGGVWLFVVLAVFAGLYIGYNVFEQGRELLGLEFGAISIPFLGYVGAVWAYTISSHLPASGAFVISIFYAYFLGRVARRAAEKGKADGRY